MASHRLKPLFSIKECMTCGSLYTRECCSIGSLENKILVPEPDSSPCCAKCGTPVDGPYCRGCALLRKEFEEDLLTYCVENGIFQDSQDTFESSDDNTNVINVLQEPIVVNQDPGVKSSQGPPLINQNCCYECGDSLDGIFCQQCICKFCGKGAHYGYNCPPKVPIISNPEQCNQTIAELPQTLPIVHPTCNYENENSFIYDSKLNSSNDFPSVLTYPPQLQFETYLCELCGNNAHYELLLKLINDLQLLKGIQQEKKKPTAQSSIPNWNSSMIDDEEAKDNFLKDVFTFLRKFSRDIIAPIFLRTKAIIPDLPIEELDNSLSMGDEHLDTISSVEILVPISSEFKGISDDTCNVPVRDDSSIFDALNDNSEILSDSNNDDTSSDDDDFEDVDYVSFEEMNDVEQEEKEFDLEDIFQIQDVILCEKLLNVHRLITNIESLKVNPITDRVLKSPSPFPIPVTNSDSIFKESDTSFSHSGLTSIAMNNNSTNDPLLELPEFESFHFDPSFPRPPPEPSDVEICLHFELDAPVIDNFNEFNDDQRGSEIDFSQNVEDDDSFTFVIWTFLPFFTYPEDSPVILSFRNEDLVFDPDIFTFHFSLKIVPFALPKDE
ncbi:hypothetical protein Tco_1280346 [Tanacetum coccineum]